VVRSHRAVFLCCHWHNRNNKQEKLSMQNKQDKRKRTKKEIKIHDLKPKKDAKGGGGPGHNIVGGNVIAGSH